MKKIIYLALILAALFSLAGCARLKQEYLNGLTVKDSSVTLSGVTPVQKVSFRLTLHNGGREKIRVDWVRPVVDGAFKAMMMNQELTVNVGKDIPAGDSLEITGKFQVKTNGIPKEQLDKMGKLVKSFQVSSRVSFDAPELQVEAASEAKATGEVALKVKATPTPKP